MLYIRKIIKARAEGKNFDGDVKSMAIKQKKEKKEQKEQKEQKELRKMNRTELIEIIYALQQDEKSLRAEIDELKERLDEKIICIENSGSIAEAALKLNHIFQDAENAARQYIESVKSGMQRSSEPAEEDPKGV